MSKSFKTCHLFIAIDYQNRLVKFSSVTNITAYRFMMSARHPTYEIINDDNPYIIKDDLFHKIMNRIEDCRYRTGNQFRTYHLDHYRIQTVIRLLTHSKSHVSGNDELICLRCEESFIGDYKNINDIRQFVSLDISYCSEDCISQTKVTKGWYPKQRYCKCGDVFTPTHKLDFYCKLCSK